MRFSSKVKVFLHQHKPTKRRLIQLYAALLFNANAKGYISGEIFTGASKVLCAPGMNCYSCPGAVFACPLGSLQAALSSSKTRAPTYVLGIILLYALIFGRTICGWLCPGGLFQDLLYKVKSFKITKGKVTRALSYLKYLLFGIFVVLVPLMYGLDNIAIPAFCKYICPIGTFEGGVLLLGNPNNLDLFQALKEIFTWKFALLIVTVLASIFIYRPFCRFICPLGAFYSLFNRLNILGVKVEESSCTHCGRCTDVCKLDVKTVGDHECINCGECIPVCPTHAISYKGSTFFLGTPVNLPEVVFDQEKEIFAEKEPLNEEQQAYKKKKKALTLIVSIACAASLIGVGTYAALEGVDFSPNDPITSSEVSSSSSEAKTKWGVGDVCPSYPYEAYNNEAPMDLNNSRGKVTFINFWYTTCGGCIEELPYFEQIAKDYATQVEVYALHSIATYEDVQQYLDDVFPSSPIHFYHDAEEFSLYKALGGKGWPMTYVLDKEGVIRYVETGGMTYEILKQRLESLL